MSCATTCAKIFLIVVNALFFLIGLSMFVMGLLIRFSADLTKQAFAALEDQLKKAGQDAGKDIDTAGFSIADIVSSVIIPLIIIGLIIAVLSVLGLIGVICSVKPVLIVYFVITLLLFLVQLVLLLIFVIDRSVYDDTIKPELKDSLKEDFVGFAGKDSTSLIWNAIMIELKCCGVDGGTDFVDAVKWNRTSGDSDGGTLQTPVACCKEITQDFACAETPTDVNNNQKTGCYESMYNYIISDRAIVIGATCGYLAFQLLILIFTVVLMVSMGKVDPME